MAGCKSIPRQLIKDNVIATSRNCQVKSSDYRLGNKEYDITYVVEGCI